MINVKLGMKGIFHLTFTNQKTGAVREKEFNNMILNSGLDRYGTAPFIAGCILGGDSTDPVATQTTIGSILGTSTTLQSQGTSTSNTTTMPYMVSHQWTYRFDVGVATGNINQIAMAFGTVNTGTNAYTGLFSLARVKDSGGSPITITKLADEVLDVRYTLQLFAPSADSTGTVTIGADTYNYTMRPAKVGDWDANLWSLTNMSYNLVSVYTGNVGTQLSAPSGTKTSQSTSISLGSYTAGTFSRDVSVVLGLDRGNAVGGIRSVILAEASSTASCWQIQYNRVSDSATIPKDNTKTLTLNFRFTWARA